MDKNSLKVRIVSPGETIFESEAKSVSAQNSQGKFDILPLHANFITLVENQPITIEKLDHTKVQFTFPLAIIYAYLNQVSIYTYLQSQIK